jgi:hypothetical protein
MSDSFDPKLSDNKELLGMVVASVHVMSACVHELRRRKFDMSVNDNWFMACDMVKTFYTSISRPTLLGYVGNLRAWLEMAEDQLPAVFNITYRRRSARKPDAELNPDSVDATLDSKTVHGGGSHSRGGSGGGKAAVATPKKVTFPFFCEPFFDVLLETVPPHHKRKCELLLRTKLKKPVTKRRFRHKKARRHLLSAIPNCRF